VSRVLPLAVALVVLVAGYLWLVQPRIADYRRIRVEAQTLETRVRLLQETVDRGRALDGSDRPDALRLFEKRVSDRDRVADVVERLTRAVAESAADGRLRNLTIATGDQAARSIQVRPAAVGETDTADPRWTLFPYSLTHTPVSLSFEASYATIAGFFSRIRDLPTAVEIRSVKLTRGLPLMSVEMTAFVVRRGDAQPDAGTAVLVQQARTAPWYSGPEQLPADALTPRVVQPRGPGG
jgi:hypothetical protein